MKIKKRLLSIAIAIIFVFFVGYGIEVFYPSPDMEEHCPSNTWEYQTQELCETNGGTWNINHPKTPESNGFCEISKKCRDSFKDIDKSHDRVVFIVSILIGILTIIGGMLNRKESISFGLISGAILLLIYGTLSYWEHADNILKFILLGITLGILIWIGMKKIR